MQPTVSTEQFLAMVEKLEDKIGLLKGAYDNAQNQIEQLKIENFALNERLKEKQNQLKELRKKPPISEKNTPKSKDIGIIVKDNLVKTDTNAEFKQQLDEYIRELERCIAHLSSLS